LADLSKLDKIHPSLLVAMDNRIVLADADSGALALYDLTSHALSAGPSQAAGKLVDITASAAGDGVYLLSAQPAVWFYRFDGNSLSKLSVSFEDWPAGRAIASYGSNLYVLANDGSQVYKHIKTAGGFSGKSAYFSPDTAASIAGSPAMAVDGAIYLAQTNGIKRFLQGRLDTSLNSLPESLHQISRLESVADGKLIVGRDSKTNRIGLFSASTTTLIYLKQLEFKKVTQLAGVSADSKGQTLFGIADGKLVTVAIP
jgi:hypothetical protein